jgi:hypothetical protein
MSYSSPKSPDLKTKSPLQGLAVYVIFWRGIVFKHNPDKRIKVLKIALGATTGALIATLYAAGRLDQDYKRVMADNKINHRMLMRFAELAEPYLAEQIKKEFEFDVVTRHLDL